VPVIPGAAAVIPNAASVIPKAASVILSGAKDLRSFPVLVARRTTAEILRFAQDDRLSTVNCRLSTRT